MSTPAARRAKPYGRTEAMAELLAAARTLFAERGFDAVGVRDISQLANVNHALMHRHFGTKEKLLRELMRAEAAGFSRTAGDVSDPVMALRRLFAANATDATFSRILAYSLLSKADLDDVIVADGTLKHISDALDSVSDVQPPSASVMATVSARETTAIVTALALGWLLFEPFLAASTGIDDSELPQTRSRVEELIGELVERSIAATPPQSSR